jgi:4a-hydroxytetrahydrobiopterin dehydratase
VSDHDEQLKALGARWRIADNELHLALRGPMTRTGQAAAAAGRLADELDHHPKIVLEYAGMALSINTHDQQAITARDFEFASRFEAWLRENGWST